MGFVGVFAAIACIGAGGDDAAAAGVVVQDFVQGAETAVVHVGSADGDVAQGGWAEFADVGWVVGGFIETEVVGGVGEFTGEVVEAVVGEFDAVGAVGSLIDRFAAEGEAAVAARTA